MFLPCSHQGLRLTIGGASERTDGGDPALPSRDGDADVLSPFPREMTIKWNVTPLAISAEGLEPPQCRDCLTTLNLHQPDEGRPDQLLGTCADCGAWYLIEASGTAEAFQFDLPNVAL